MCIRAPAIHLPLDFLHSQVDIQGCSTFFLTSTVADHLRKNLTLVELVLSFAATILFVAPGMLSVFSWIALGGALVVWCTVISKTRKNKQIVAQTHCDRRKGVPIC